MHKRENLASALREGTSATYKTRNDDQIGPFSNSSPCMHLSSGLAVTLKCLLEDEDGVVRERSAKVLGIIARKSGLLK